MVAYHDLKGSKEDKESCVVKMVVKMQRNFRFTLYNNQV
jgi:hypothetical protein